MSISPESAEGGPFRLPSVCICSLVSLTFLSLLYGRLFEALLGVKVAATTVRNSAHNHAGPKGNEVNHARA
jgi:hypothetical protein